MKRYEALGRGDAFEDSARRTHGLMAANNKRTSAAIRVLNEKDREPDRVCRVANVIDKPGGSEPGATMNLTSPITLNVPLAVPEGPAEGPDVAQVPPPVGGSPPPKVPWPLI